MVAEVLQQLPLVLAAALPDAGLCVVVGIVLQRLGVPSQLLPVALQYLCRVVRMPVGRFPSCNR